MYKIADQAELRRLILSVNLDSTTAAIAIKFPVVEEKKPVTQATSRIIVKK